MESASKNKRGRPRTAAREVVEQTRHMTDKCDRAAVNDVYHSVCFTHLSAEQRAFFVTPHGRSRRNGIAEQIGRLYDADIITEAEIGEIADACIDLYNRGYTVKQIEQHLRNRRREILISNQTNIE